MPTAPAEKVDHLRRAAGGCLCCGSRELKFETHIVSGFLAERAWGGPPQLTQLATCASCGLRFFDRGLSDAEATRYYRGYRDANYVRTRWRWEPFYTRAQHAATLAWSESPGRRDALRQALARSNAPGRFASVLDHGGSHGHMTEAIAADRKAVFDPSASTTLPGIEAYTTASTLPGGWELILSCQVLEHVSSPATYLRDLGALLADSGWLYLEVPAESWRQASGGATPRAAWLEWLLPRRPLLMAIDTLSTASRIKLGRVPRFGFVAMREHLNYFSALALRALLTRSGFAIDACDINGAGQLYAIARKYAVANDAAVLNSKSDFARQRRRQ